jgi:hypothetical protein
VLVLGVIAAVLLLLPQRGKRMMAATLGVTLTAALLGPMAWTLDTISTAHGGSIVTAGPAVAGGTGAGFGGGRGGGAPPAARGAAPRTRGGFAGGRGGGAGSLLNSGSVGTALAALLKANASTYTWVAAAVGSDSAAGYQLATQEAVMPLGGFNGSDPSPTLAEFQADVAAGKIHYFIGGSVGQSNGGSNSSSTIASWVEAHFTAKTVDGVTLYDLTK